MFGAGRPLPSYSLLALPPLGLGAPDRHRHPSLLIVPSFPVPEFLYKRAKERANALILCPGARRVLHRIPCLVASLHATLFFVFRSVHHNSLLKVPEFDRADSNCGSPAR